MEVELVLSEEDRATLSDAVEASPALFPKDRLPMLRECLRSSGRLDVGSVRCVREAAKAGPWLPRVHELFERGALDAPALPPPPPRDPELEARCSRLRKAAELRSYDAMTSELGSPLAGCRGPNFGPGPKADSFAEDMKTVNRQLTTVLNMVLTVVGAFVFGFKASEYVVEGGVELAWRFFAGLSLATVVFFADLYFVIKTIA